MTDRPRTVLHVLNHLDHGGAQDNTLATCEGLDRRRWRVVIAAPVGGAQTGRAAFAADELIALRHLQRDLDPRRERPAYRELRAVLEQVRPDVVHTHGSKAGVLGRLAAARAEVPAVVHTLHGMPVTPTTPALLRPVLLAAERLAASRGSEVVCVCPSNLVEARALRIVPEGQGVVVASGVEEARFSQARTPERRASVRAELGVPVDAIVGIWVGRLMPQKAPLDLVAAAALALAAEPRLHLLMVGAGELLEDVTRAAAALPRLHLLGQRADVAELLAAADLFVQSSLWEGLGRALTEACLAGLPSVATAVNGIPDLITPHETGMLVPPGQPAALAKALLTAISDPDRLARWGTAAAARARGQFDTSAMVAGLDDVYTRCLAGRPRLLRPTLA